MVKVYIRHGDDFSDTPPKEKGLYIFLYPNNVFIIRCYSYQGKGVCRTCYFFKGCNDYSCSFFRNLINQHKNILQKDKQCLN